MHVYIWCACGGVWADMCRYLWSPEDPLRLDLQSSLSNLTVGVGNCGPLQK